MYVCMYVIITNVVITDIYVLFMYTARLGCGIYLTNCLKVALDHSSEDAEGHCYVFLCMYVCMYVIITNVVITDIYVLFMYTGRMGCGTYVTNSMTVALEHATEDSAGHQYVFVCEKPNISAGIFKLLS